MAKIVKTRRAKALKKAIDRWRDGAFEAVYELRGDVETRPAEADGMVTATFVLKPYGAYIISYRLLRSDNPIPDHLRRHLCSAR